jgi:hypothetical protein
MCLSPPAYIDSMQTSNAAPMPKPPVPKCDNMNKIAEEMDAFRLTQMSVRRTTNEYLMLCIIGFGSIDRRDALMRVIAWALEPILLYSAFIKDLSTQEFEAVVITKKQVSANAVEDWLGLFNMGLCCIQFDSYMQPDMVTCISRIHHMGKHWFGSFKARSSARVRRDFYKEHMKEIKAKEHQRLLDVTGLTLTTRNMLMLHDRVGVLQTHVARLERQIEEQRDVIPEHALQSLVAISERQIEQRRAAMTAAASSEDIRDLERDATTVAMVSRFAQSAGRLNLASAYRRMQANVQLRDLPAAAQLQAVHEEIPPPPPPMVDLTSPPLSPAQVPPTEPRNPQAHGITFIARPAPTGNVTVYVVRE